MFSLCNGARGIVPFRERAGVGIAVSEKGGFLFSLRSIKVHVSFLLLFPLGAGTGWLDLCCALMVGGAWFCVTKTSVCSLSKLSSVRKKKLNAFNSKEAFEEWVRGTESSLPLNQTMDWRTH